MAIPVLKSAFASGELAPSLYGSVDLAKYAQGCATARNLFVNHRGGLLSRPGTAFVGMSAQTGSAYPPRLIPFQFSYNQAYVLEFGNLYMRVISRGAYVTETPTTITGITQANPGVVSDSGQSYVNGDWVYLSGIGGMTQLNGQTFVVAGRTSSGFALHDQFGNPINTTGFGAYTSGGTAARIFTLTTPYAAVDLPLLKFAQSADVMSITHGNYAPQELTRLGPANWTIAALNPGGGALASPGNLTAAASNTTTTNPASYSYVVTAIDTSGNESERSSAATVTNSVNMAGTAGSVTLDWAQVSGAKSYNIYRAPIAFGGAVPAGQIFGYLGSSLASNYIDTNGVPDFSLAPPIYSNPFAPGQITGVVLTGNGTGYSSAPSFSITTSTGSGFNGFPVMNGAAMIDFVITNAGKNYAASDTITFSGGGGSTQATATLTVGPQSGTYPGTVSYYQTRRAYASTLNNPDTLFFSKPGNFTDFDQSIPVVDDDAIIDTPWGQQVNAIYTMINMPGGLVVGTGLGAWLIMAPNSFGANQNPITPSNLLAVPQAQNGFSAFVPPIRILYDIVYVDGKGSIVRDLQYNFWISIYTGTDLTILSAHLFEGHYILDWCWSESPNKIIWACRDDGALLGLTFLKEQEIYGWTRHDTQGAFLAACAVPEPVNATSGNAIVDAPYFAVERTINGTSVYYIERMDNRIWASLVSPWCVDCGLKYVGALTNTLSGLTFLVGQSVVGLGDGVPFGPLTVSASGTITLPFSAATIIVGLPFTPQVQTMYLDAGQPTIQGRRKSLVAATIRVTNTCRIQAGANQPDGSAQFPPSLAPAWSNMVAVPDQGGSFVNGGGATGTNPFTGDLRVPIFADWRKPGQIAVQQTNPLPLEVIAIVPEFLPGDMPEAAVAPAPERGRGGGPQQQPMAA